MLENFDSRARRAVVLAQGEARLLCHQSAGIDHLLLALLYEEGTIFTLFKRAEVTYSSAYHAVEERHPPGVDPVLGVIPFATSMKLAAQTARSIALLANDKEPVVQDLHLLLSLFCIEDTTVPDVLEKLNCNQSALINKLVQLLGLPTPFIPDDYRLPDITQLRREVHGAVDKVSSDQLRVVLNYLDALPPSEPKQDLTE